MTSQFSYLDNIPSEKNNLIKGLQTIQEEEGFLSDDALVAAASYFSVPVVDVEGVVSFYTQFKRTKPGKYHVAVCDGTACHIKGATLLTEWITTELDIRDGETDPDGLFSLETVACLGCCSLAPVISVNGKVHGNLDRKKLIKTLKQYKEAI